MSSGPAAGAAASAGTQSLRRVACAAGLLAATGCGRDFSALSPAGPQAQRISDLTWFMISLGSAVYLLVIGFLFYALWRGSRRVATASGPEVERRMKHWVIGGVGATGTILLVLLVYNLAIGRAIAAFADEDALTIRVVGHQWWWEVIYEDPQAHRRVTTANEIRIPVGRKIRLLGQSRDVIHSFWVPNLHGKMDLIPGYGNTTFFRADRVGVFQGKCAEFCGMQHAKMDFLVIAEEPESFAAWYEQELQPAPAPADSVEQRGQEVFLTRGCVLCHTVRGTPAGSRFGPDLTHLASRRTIGAGALPNTRGHLGGWVSDPQRIKPGVYMPPNQLNADELNALLRYLESLK